MAVVNGNNRGKFTQTLPQIRYLLWKLFDNLLLHKLLLELLLDNTGQPSAAVLLPCKDTTPNSTRPAHRSPLHINRGEYIERLG